MKNLGVAAIALVGFTLAAPAAPAAPPASAFDAAAAFGARPSAADVSLSPDGSSIAYVAPTKGLGSVVYTVSLEPGATPKVALVASGKPERVAGCGWVSNERLVCEIHGIVSSADITLAPVHRLFAINADGGNPKLLSNAKTFYTRGFALGGGSIVDWLPERDGAVLMSRIYLPDVHLGSHIGSSKEGLGVDLLDTRSLQSQTVEPALAEARRYISDGQGTVRVMELNATRGPGEQDTGLIHFRYRRADSHEWQALGDFNLLDRSGFLPYAVDRERNVAFGARKVDGRMAIVAVALDGSVREELIYASPDVDVDDLIRIGRRHRVVGISYVTDIRRAVYFDTDIKKVVDALQQALPQHPAVQIVDATVDESRLLVFASRDTDPGTYYLYERRTHQLRPLLAKRQELDGVTLATVHPISYPAKDGTAVPAYLTMPPGKESAKGLPAIVMPHGGPDTRDEWGFDWLAQFYAARGFAVLQPNFRGSWGYGDEWYQHNGFQSWPTAIGDVLDAGRWLVAQGIAAPGKIGIVGWSYGGYAALQTAVTDPSVFKAVVAIAPVTDLESLKEERRHWSNFTLTGEFIGEGPHVRAGSPARNAEKIKVPVLMFHGALDRNVSINESRLMAKSLQSAGVPHELVTWDDLDHQLDDSNARAQMLRKSEAFLRQAFGE
jgi:acetyl esterase/lipase